MNDQLRYNVADQRLSYAGRLQEFQFENDRIIEFNHRHKAVLNRYELTLESCAILNLSDRINYQSNLGALRNRQLRQSVILSAALSAIAVGLHGRGSLKQVPKHLVTSELKNNLKRANDRTAALVMSEVLQMTTETLPVGEEVIIESAITEGVRVKPGVEAGGNPTIPVGAVFGKPEHRLTYGLRMPANVALLSLGNDVIDGTGKSVEGLHSSFTALVLTESGVKRHLPDTYVQRWMANVPFEEFNPRETKIVEIAEIISKAYGYGNKEKLSAFFLDRPRHRYAMDILNKAGVATPFDKDGDLMPAIVMGLDGLGFPDGRPLSSMIGEIGGSAEWAVGVLPLVWRGGHAMGMLTSQSSLTRKDLSEEDLWKERFHFTEDEFMSIQDARFQRKPYFTVTDILDDPMAGGISAFGAITDNYFVPLLTGVEADAERKRIKVNVLVVNSIGMVDAWMMTFTCNSSIAETTKLMISPKESLEELAGADLERAIGELLQNPRQRSRYLLFFNNEYYPALIPIHDKMVLLNNAVKALLDRSVINEKDREIISCTQRLAPELFVNSEF
jgi:fructose-1,6-bisphosphatase/sedoheptulose 1,7-bisphosphatase-like protein